MAQAQKRLPDVYCVHAWGMGDLMITLKEQVGIPLREMIDLSPQQLYDLTRAFTDDEDLKAIEHLVVIDDETGEALKELIRQTVDRFRPENRGVAHNVAIEARSIALKKTALEPDSAISLTELEKRLWDVTGEPAVVLEDDDFAAYGVEMNRIISARPHGRSRALDGVEDEPDETGVTATDNAERDARPSVSRGPDPYQIDRRIYRRPDSTTMAFLIATTVLTRFGHRALQDEPDTEPTVMLMAGPVNNAMARRDSAALAMRTGKDVVYLEFERGKAAKGPKNLIVFEMSNGELTTWDRCTLWSRPDNLLTVILPRGRDFAFGFDGVGIRRMTGAPTENLAPGFAAAKAELVAVANRMTPEMFDEIHIARTHFFPAGDC